jgi:hypothetical protein
MITATIVVCLFIAVNVADWRAIAACLCVAGGLAVFLTLPGQ